MVTLPLMMKNWIIGQAVINIAMVSGLLPVIGVPLPCISYGGSGWCPPSPASA